MCLGVERADPPHSSPPEDSDVTEVMWQAALRRGGGLEAHGYVVRVWDTGIYLLYSQVTPDKPRAHLVDMRLACHSSYVPCL